ncbi:OTU ovarian tumor-like cysteine protease [Phytophthora palmivora]|uniref:OTU ovarian tumor-like cysteine protease n=1 Tax=Phytophthora palmivora TaxID=4796 RepID=A0A2P4YQT2_9STRA|nr:OTU ovarian tumor-like cysteine protease [Phytophthora palmivora]
MSLAWLRNHARNRDGGTTRTRSNSQRLAAYPTRREFAGAEAYAPRITYDNSFVVDSSVTSRDANWTTDDQYKRQYLRLGWEVAPIRKDGNCLFRALSDQLYGHERRHLELRRRLVDFINLGSPMFLEHLKAPRGLNHGPTSRGAYERACHPELVAASRLLGITIIVHTGPVKRLRIDTDKFAKTKEGKGKTINLLLKHDHYSSLRKREKPLDQQHGCSDMCLCRRIVTPSRASLDSRASLGARPSELGSSFVGRSSDVGRRSSLGARPADISLGTEKHRLKGAYGRKPVPGVECSSDESSPVHKKHQKVFIKPKSRLSPPEKPKTLAPAPPSQSVPLKPKTSVPAAPGRPKAPAPAPPTKAKSPVSSPPNTVASPTRQQASVQHKAASPRTKPRSTMPSPPEKPKTPGVVLFQPEALKPVVKPKAPLVVLFEPEQNSAPKPTSSPVSKKATVNTATPVKPTSAVVLDVEVEEPESNAGLHEEVPLRSVHKPRRAVFNGGRRRRSSAAALSLMQEVSASLNVSAPEVSIKPVAVVKPVAKPNPPAPRSMEIKKSSKKVFRQGRPVTAC